MRRPTRWRAIRPGCHEIDDGQLQLVVRELEDILGAGKETVRRQKRPELANLVEEEIRVPMLAVELVTFDIGKHAVRQRDHLVVGRAILIRTQQFPIALDEFLPLGLQPFDRPLQGISGLHPLDIFGQAGKRHRQIVVPGAVIVIKPVAYIDVEPRMSRDLELLEPRLSRRPGLFEGRDDVIGRHVLLELGVHAELHGATRQAPQLIVGPEDLRFHPGHHASDSLIGDLGKGLLAEGEECKVGAVAEQEEFEVVMPHPEVPFEGLLVRVEQVVIRGNPAPRMNVLERLELR